MIKRFFEFWFELIVALAEGFGDEDGWEDQIIYD